MDNILEQVEKEILSRIKKNDPKAFEELFRRYYPALLQYANPLLKDEDLAKDAVQTVFIHIWEKRNELDINKSLKAYLFRSAYNAGINLLKQKQLNKKSRIALAILHPGVEQSFLLDLEARELEERIQSALEKLPGKCRQVFELSRHDKLKNREVAQRMNISIKTVEAHLSKALKSIKKKLETVSD